MKKILALVLVVLLTASAAFAAQYGIPSRNNVRLNTAYVTSCAHITTRPADVYSITIKALTAQGWASLLDSASGAAADVITAVDAETNSPKRKVVVGEATQYDSDIFNFDPPIHFENGIFFYDGVGTVAAPSSTTGVEAVISYRNTDN